MPSSTASRHSRLIRRSAAASLLLEEVFAVEDVVDCLFGFFLVLFVISVNSADFFLLGSASSSCDVAIGEGRSPASSLVIEGTVKLVSTIVSFEPPLYLNIMADFGRKGTPSLDDIQQHERTSSISIGVGATDRDRPVLFVIVSFLHLLFLVSVCFVTVRDFALLTTCDVLYIGER
jgi:hypothetical protein